MLGEGDGGVLFAVPTFARVSFQGYRQSIER